MRWGWHVSDESESETEATAPVQEKARPLLERVYSVIEYLKGERRAVDADEVLKHTGVDPRVDVEVVDAVASNNQNNVSVDRSRLIFQYQTRYGVHNKEMMLKVIARHKLGLPHDALAAEYSGAGRDLQQMVLGGDVIAVKIRSGLVYFPREVTYLTKTMPIAVSEDGTRGKVNEDPSHDFAMGEAIRIGTKWFRINMPHKKGKVTSAVVRCTKPGLDVESGIPLQCPDGTAGMPASMTVRHGCTHDIYRLWQKTANLPEGDFKLIEDDLGQLTLKETCVLPRILDVTERRALERRVSQKRKQDAWRDDVRRRTQDT